MRVGFTRSVKMGIEVILTHLLNHRDTNWPTPFWANFSWFDEIQADEAQIVECLETDGIIKVQREIRFFLKKDLVVAITMEGQEYHDTERKEVGTAWAVRKVRYRLLWDSRGGDARWVERELPITSYTAIP